MVELKTSWYSFITPLQAGAIAAGAGPERLAPLESLGRHLGAAFQITDDLLNLRADPEEYGKEIGGDLWEGKRTLMLLHALRCAEPDDRDRAVQILAKRRPRRRRRTGAERTTGSTHRPRRTVPVRAGRDRGSAAGTVDRQEPKSLNDIRWLYELMHRVGSLKHARDVAARHATGSRHRARQSRLVAAQPTPRRAGRPRRLRTRADPMNPEDTGRHARRAGADPRAHPRPRRAQTPQLLPAPPDEAAGTERTVYDLLLGARRAVLGNPAAARGLHDLLVAEGRRYADTPDGAQLRDALVASEAVENLRRVWETVSLNVLDGPAAAQCRPRRLGGSVCRRRHRAWPRRFHPGPPAARGVRMTLTDPRDALADQSNFIGYLMGLARLARVVHALAADGDRRVRPTPRRQTTSSTCCSALRAWERRSSDSPNPRRLNGIRDSEPAAGSTTTRWLR